MDVGCKKDMEVEKETENYTVRVLTYQQHSAPIVSKPSESTAPNYGHQSSCSSLDPGSSSQNTSKVPEFLKLSLGSWKSFSGNCSMPDYD